MLYDCYFLLIHAIISSYWPQNRVLHPQHNVLNRHLAHHSGHLLPDLYHQQNSPYDSGHRCIVPSEGHSLQVWFQSQEYLHHSLYPSVTALQCYRPGCFVFQTVYVGCWLRIRFSFLLLYF